MHGCVLSDLPEVFVGFAAYKAMGSQIVLFNKDCVLGFDEDRILREYSYLVDSSSFTVRNSEEGKKIFFAERYGGDFISRNGGGGRCGFDGLLQVKGIGRTPLVGGHKDAIHSNGMLDLESAIHEAIWGDIIQLALPYGAARTVAVISINEEFELDGAIHSRALLVREAVVRPAHFERANLFKEKVIPGRPLSKDALRVRNAMQRINDFLPRPCCSDLPNSSRDTDADLFRSGIAELAKRYAEQFAVARSKNIMHMMMSSSNLSITGCWLDLNSATVVSSISVKEKRLYQRFETEYFPAIRSLENICYYAKKYLALAGDVVNEVFTNALSIFERRYDLTLRKNVVMRAGFPCCVVEAMAEGREFNQFSEALLKLMRQRTYDLGEEQIFGGLRFYSVAGCPRVVSLNKGRDSPGINIGIEWNTPNRYFKEELDGAFESFFTAALLKTDLKRHALVCILSINLTKYSRTPLLLQNVKLYEIIRCSIKSAGRTFVFNSEVHSLFCEAKDAAELCLGTDKKQGTLLWQSGENFIEYDGVFHVFRLVSDGCERLVSWAEIVLMSEDLPIAESVIGFYESVHGVFFEV